jgi:pimeloyl-ACP methyl ester carboxylesterase
MATPRTETIQLGHCGFEAKVKVAGSGSPVFFLHTAGGPTWDVFLDALAEQHTVYAPDHPGLGETDRYSIHQVDTLWDLVLIYDELLDRLGLDGAAIVGSSFGGMMAAEMAAHRRDRVSKLVIMSAIGLWREDRPVAPYMLMSAPDLVDTLFADTSPPAVQAFLTPPADRTEAAIAQADLLWALGTTGKFVWPIPDKGLQKRLHRITAPTLILWGEKDALVSADYADEFAARIADSRVEIIDGVGHVPQWEKPEAVNPLVLDFLAD